MEDDVRTIKDYIWIAWRRKFYILIPFVLVLAATIATLFLLPPVYKSTGTILIESQQIPEELIQSTVTSFADERIQVIQQRLMTSQQLFEIIKKFNLYKDEINKTPRSEILGDMRQRISIERVSANVRNQRRGSRALIAFTVSFEHESPGVAQRVANELVTLFLDENIRSRTARAEETSEFLGKEGDRLKIDIERMQEQIAQFKQENEGSLPETMRLNLERVVSLKSSLAKADNNLEILKENRKLLEIELETLRLNPGSINQLSDEERTLREELRSLQNRYISLSARYGADHPDVKAAERQLEAFESEYGALADVNDLEAQREQVRQEMVELSKNYSSEHPDMKKLQREMESIEAMIDDATNGSKKTTDKKAPSPAALQTQAKIDSIDSNLRRIERSRAELEAQIAALEARISRTPQVERGLDSLQRDYENTRRKYQEIKAKQLQAELSKSLEEEQKGERFTLLEPPLRPDRPIKPNRPKLLALGLILSMVGGIGVAGVAETFDGGIRGSRALASVTRMTPLVTIPYITTRKDEARRKRIIKFAIVAVIFLGLAFLAAVHFFYKPLDLLWFIVLRKLNLA